MTESQCREGTRLVRRIHASSTGRVRLVVPGLYRSPKIKRELENWLSRRTGVRRVEANIRTGRLLVVYAPELELVQLIGAIESRLGRQLPVRLQASVAEQPASPSRPLSLNILKSLQGFSSLLGKFPPLFGPSPVMGEAVGAAPDLSLAREIQDIMPWHVMKLDAVLKQLRASPDSGLSDGDVQTRLAHYGENSLTAAKACSDLAIFFGQFNSPPVFLLASVLAAGQFLPRSVVPAHG